MPNQDIWERAFAVESNPSLLLCVWIQSFLDAGRVNTLNICIWWGLTKRVLSSLHTTPWLHSEHSYEVWQPGHMCLTACEGFRDDECVYDSESLILIWILALLLIPCRHTSLMMIIPGRRSKRSLPSSWSHSEKGLRAGTQLISDDLCWWSVMKMSVFVFKGEKRGLNNNTFLFGCEIHHHVAFVRLRQRADRQIDNHMPVYGCGLLPHPATWLWSWLKLK